MDAILQHIEQVLDAFQDGIWISDAQSVCLYVNRKYEELTGLSREAMIGQKATSILAQGVFDAIVNPEVISSGRPVSKMQKLSNGKYLSLDGYPIFDEDGKCIMCINFVRDVSMLRAMEDKLSHQREVLNRLISINNNSDILTAEDGSNILISPTMRSFLAKVRRMARTDISILILGETGAGKDVMAQRIHSLSDRSEKPFIKVDCGSISPTLIEAELFGYVSGAFSGADKRGRVGLIEAASGGTIFFDEVGELPLQLQTRLLRFLQEGVVVPVGSNTPKKVDVRVVAATNKDLKKAVEVGEFRSDLYYRLKIAVLNIPPLRSRKEDIIPLAKFFFQHFCRRYNRSIDMAEEVYPVLLEYDWPGNVRELKNLMQEMSITCPDKVLNASHLSLSKSYISDVATSEGAVLEFDFDKASNYHDIMRELECRMLKAAIKKHAGNMAAAARMLGMDRSTIFRKIKELEKHGMMVR